MGSRFPIPLLDAPVEDWTSFSFGALEVKVVHSPGRSPASACYEMEGKFFAGGALGSAGLGRTDLLGVDAAALRGSFLRLTREYSAGTVLHRGHDETIFCGNVKGEIPAGSSPWT